MNSRTICVDLHVKSYDIKRQVIWCPSKTYYRNEVFLYWESCHQSMAQIGENMFLLVPSDDLSDNILKNFF